MKIAMTILTIILSLVTVLISFVFVNRLTFSYNSEGRYFDESSLIVYHKQAVAVYGLLFFIGLVLTLLAFYKTRKAFYK
jgi:cell division protein FtsX